MKNQLSALIDGELEIDSADHLIASAKAGGELKQCWVHYHLIGDAMRGEMNTNHSLSHRVMSALEAEPTVLAPNRLQESLPEEASAVPAIYLAATNSRLWSIAASVAAVMFVGVMVLQLNQTEELMPVEIAQSVPTEYLQAHQAAAPNSAAFYIQTASYTEPQQ
jgi:sigma-E factor negative regulatory protein RseA